MDVQKLCDKNDESTCFYYRNLPPSTPKLIPIDKCGGPVMQKLNTTDSVSNYRIDDQFILDNLLDILNNRQ